ncbi:transposase [Candidatus Paracaedibacter symbiosus]|uniref:transposase n=1 Tax=Candidatus Paracaedibacter symbiosus TaxID=244582 RepID=UPI0004F87E1E|nr:transposase [Candidatus Paracaedibacter symbiosus]AIL13769.1 transposase [Candidatus Paracaedimonas acanthamoebae]AIL13833.1 transposase [Candidatus Paracaedimonas acanthamoebae]
MKKSYGAEQIIGLLRQSNVLLSQGKSIIEVCRQLGISDATYYKWRKVYGGLKVNQARRLKELERENARLKRAVADLTLDKLILKEAAEGNF